MITGNDSVLLSHMKDLPITVRAAGDRALKGRSGPYSFRTAISTD